MSSKIEIRVEGCEPGMRVAETVFNAHGAVIIAQGGILDSNIIKKLEMMGVQKIKIFQISNKEIEENSEIKKRYRKHVVVIKDVIKDISQGKNLDIKKVNNIIDSFMENSREARGVISCLHDIKDVDEYTYTHSINVALLAMMIGKWMNLTEAKIKDLAYAGLLHDIGKAKVKQEVLNKPGKLTPEEFEEMKMHVVHAYRMLEKIPDLNKDIISGVLMHHEREDGSGYVLGAKGSQIHEYAKIIAVADVYDAMTSDRVYKTKLCPFDVFEMFQKGELGKFDQRVLSTFLAYAANYYVGDKCLLSNGDVGNIAYINTNNIARPLVKIGKEYIYLSKESELKIVELL